MPDNNRKSAAVITGIIILNLFFFTAANADDASAKAKAEAQALTKAAQTQGQAEAVKEKAPAKVYRRELERAVIEEEAGEVPAQTIDTYFRYIPSRGAKATSGSVAIMDTAAEYAYNFKVFGKLPVEAGIEQRYIGIRNTTEVKLPAHLVEVAGYIDTTFPVPWIDKTYFRLGINPGFYGEDWDLHSSSFRIPFYSLAIYQLNDKLTLMAGLAVFPEYEDMFVPVGGLIYKPNDKLIFNLTPKNPNIAYSLNDKTTVFLNADISGGEYEVDKDDLKKITLQYNETHLGGGVRYKFNKYIDGFLGTGYMFNRSLKYRDSLGKVSLKNGIYTEFRVEISI